MCRWAFLDPEVYPAARDRPDPAPLPGGTGYARYQTVTGLVASSAVMTEVGRFAGIPDAIDLVSVNGSSDVILTDEFGTEESRIRLVSGITVPMYIRRRVVLAQIASAPDTPTVFAIGKWRV